MTEPLEIEKGRLGYSIRTLIRDSDLNSMLSSELNDGKLTEVVYKQNKIASVSEIKDSGILIK